MYFTSGNTSVSKSQAIPVTLLTLWSITVITPSLTLEVKRCHLTPATQGPITPTALRFLTAVAEVPTVRSGLHLRVITEDFPDGPMDKNPPASAGDIGSIPGPGRFHTPQKNLVRAPQLLNPPATTTVAPAARARAPQQEMPP